MAAKNQSIFLKARYLEKELEETESIFMDNYNLFFKEVAKISGEVFSSLEQLEEKQLEDSSDEECGEQPSDSGSAESGLDKKAILKNKDIKSLYTRIVTICHPDKHAEYLKESEKNKLTKIYQKCINSAENNNLFGILSCAKSLYLDIPELSSDDIVSIEKDISVFEEKINSMKNTYVWLWINSDNKESIVNKFINSRS